MLGHEKLELKPARRREVREIAQMSHDLIETGLGWSWTPQRVARAQQDPDTIVLTAQTTHRLLGFAIMKFFDTAAHLNLLAVYPSYRRTGIGRQLVTWLEDSARVAGTFDISLEVRAKRTGAVAFYRTLGYRISEELNGYYGGREKGLRLVKDLRSGRPL